MAKLRDTLDAARQIFTRAGGPEAVTLEAVAAKTPVSTVYEYYQPDVRDEAQPVLLEVQ